ncbi:MAG: prolyl oligopeptidase family serine peptidase [Kiritimatiellia bacterium]
MPWLEHRYGHTVQEYYVRRVREVAAQRVARLAAVRTRADALRLQDELRQRVRRALGPFPKESPLRSHTTGRLDSEGYRVEKLLIESRPGFFVSANLYLPEGRGERYPAVLGACGHAQEGKAFPAYQSFAQGLAKKDFVVLLYDPISQGERVQYPDRIGRCSLGLCAEHNMLGRQMSLLGDWFGRWRIWDGIRCLDYLLGRPEVDPTRVGMTGNSGGGTLTRWLCAVDERFSMAAPGCFVTTWLSNLENELPADVEQIPPRALALGLDLSDFFVPFAPRPLLLLTQRADYFDQRGSEKALLELRKIYRLLGAEKNVCLQVGPGRHGYSIENREAMYAFFMQHAGVNGTVREPSLKLHSANELAVTPQSSVHKAGSRLVFDFVRQHATELTEKRKAVTPSRLRRLIRKLLAIPPWQGRPHHRVLRAWTEGKITWQPYAIETEPGIQAIVTMLCPDGDQYAVPAEEECCLLVPHLAAWDDLHNARIRKLLDRRGRVLAVDPRGIGQSRPQGCNCQDFFSPYDCDYFFDAYGLLLDQPYLGRRVFDVLRTLGWLRAWGYRRIHLAGRGLGAITALFAAVLEPGLQSVTLINGLLSYDELTGVPIYRWPASAHVSGILRFFDLPDCFRLLRKKLSIVAPWDHRMKTLPASVAGRRLREEGLRTNLKRI